MKYAIDIPYPFLNAIVPTVGFNLSTLSLPCVERIWRWYNSEGKCKKPGIERVALSAV